MVFARTAASRLKKLPTLFLNNTRPGALITLKMGESNDFLSLVLLEKRNVFWLQL